MRIKKGLVIIGCLLSLALTAFAVTEPTYAWRLLTYPRRQPITAVKWYKPLEAVKGSQSTSLTVAQTSHISEKALADAAAWAEERNSSVFLVMHNGQIVAEKYWRGFRATDTFNSMSMAKGVLSLVTGIAIAEGALSSEEAEIGQYLKEWSQDERGTIRIKHLLQMTSGLRFNDNPFNPFSDLVKMHGRPDALKEALKAPLYTKPGEAFDYTNVNSQILSTVIERATGRRYADYVSDKLWQPLGAGDAAVWLDREGGNAKAYCCFFATPRDWLRVARLMIDRGRVNGKQIVPESWIKKMTTSSDRETEYGYGIWLAYPSDKPKSTNRTIPKLVRDMYYFDGQGKQRLYVVPSKNLVIARFGENHGTWWDDAALADMVVQEMRATKTP